MCEIEGSCSKGRPLGRWKDGVKEYMCETEDLSGEEGHLEDGGIG